MTAQILPVSQPLSTAKIGRFGVATTRIVLGLAFALAGGSIVVLLGNPPPAAPGLAGTFTTVFFQSHWVVFVDFVEFSAGVLLLANRFVPFALVLVAALLSNILVFHVTMQPQTIAVPLVLAALWFVLAYQYRGKLLQLFSN